ncbi:MAG: glutamate ABC transporter substrate-binding protein [Chloroflexi bacterium]|nr:glutamate ABC transporter substrate-binding protein [Chloroflexota bacterium]
MKRWILWLSLVALVFAITGCGGTAAAPTPTTALAPAAAQPTTGAAAKGAMPKAAAGTLLRKIQDRGKLTAGVKYDVPLFGFLNPQTNKVEGFDVDMVKAVAEAIFGDPNAVEFQEAISKNRVPFLQDGVVDMVASTMTINAERVGQIDFSDPYYVAGQSLLVPGNSSISSIKDLKGKNVASAKGSTSETNIRQKAPEANVVLFDTYAEAVAAMQAGRADAVTTDDIILFGFASKDPKLKVVGGQFTVEPYGLGIQKGHQEFLDVVNKVVRDMKTSGKWAEIYKKWIPADKVPPVPPQNWQDVKLP